MNGNNRSSLAGRIVYVMLTVMAVAILIVTAYTFLGVNRQTDPPADSTSGVGSRENPGISPGTTAAPDTKPLHRDKVPETPVTTSRETEPADLPDTEEPLPVLEPAPVEEDPPAVLPLGSRVLLRPVDGIVAKKHDTQTAVLSLTMGDYRVHTGVDLEAPLGTQVVACAPGTVTALAKDPFWGTCLTLDTGGGLVAVYRNLAENMAEGIAVGAEVKNGQPLGFVGETAVLELADAPHLHFELIYEGNAIDPASVIDFSAAPVYFPEN